MKKETKMDLFFYGCIDCEERLRTTKLSNLKKIILWNRNKTNYLYCPNQSCHRYGLITAVWRMINVKDQI